MSEHLDMSKFDAVKLAAIINARCDEALHGKHHMASSMVFAAMAAGGICMCHANEFLEDLSNGLRLAIQDIRDGQADKVAPRASDVADRMLSELFTRPLKVEEKKP